MSFTTTAYYRNFEIRDPLIQIRNDLILANSNISIGAQPYIITADAIVTIPAYNLVNSYIIRSTTTAQRDDLVDTASNIILELRKKLKSQINLNFLPQGTFPNGTSFTFKMFNKSGFNIELQPNTGVTFGRTNGSINNNNASIFTMIVTGQTLLGDTADTISIINGDE